MAEASQNPPPQPVRTNKIKFKVKLRNATAGPASAKTRVSELASFPEPSAELKVLAALIDRHAEAERLLPTFPAWPQLRADISAEERPAKRVCTGLAQAGPCALTEVAGQCQEAPGNLMDVGAPEQAASQPVVAPSAQKVQATASGAGQARKESSKPRADAPVSTVKKEMATECGPKDSLNGAVASSASDQATTCAFGQNPSPTEVTAAAAAAAAAGLPPAAPAAAPSPRGRGAAGLQESDAAMTAASNTPAPVQPSKPRAPKGESIGTQTANTISLLPPNLLTSSSSNVAALPQQLALNQLMLPPHMCFMSRGQDPPPSEAEFQRLVTSARDRKRHADKERGPNPWTLGTLQMYVQSALIYLKAVECLLQLPHLPDRAQRAGSLCIQTADLLMFTVGCCQGLPSEAVVREALRTLCERLAAVCYVKDCTLNAHRYKEYAERLDRLVQEARTNAAEAAVNARRRADAVPDETHACSSDQRASTAVRPPASQASMDLQTKALQHVRHMAKFPDLVRRSVIGFQSLSEREEVRSNPVLAQVCMHISAVCMGGGCVDGERVISHAHHALKLLQKL